MTSESRHDHWQKVYTSKGENALSWFQENPAPSLELIGRAGANPASAIIDIGAGASRLVDALIERGLRSIAVLGLSEAALATARARLGGWGARGQRFPRHVAHSEPP